jgi:hypothetical protein
MAIQDERDNTRSADESFGKHRDTLVTSLTDLIDEMDRAAFHRSLANRHLPQVESVAYGVHQPRKGS